MNIPAINLTPQPGAGAAAASASRGQAGFDRSLEQATQPRPTSRRGTSDAHAAGTRKQADVRAEAGSSTSQRATTAQEAAEGSSARSRSHETSDKAAKNASDDVDVDVDGDVEGDGDTDGEAAARVAAFTLVLDDALPLLGEITIELGESDQAGVVPESDTGLESEAASQVAMLPDAALAVASAAPGTEPAQAMAQAAVRPAPQPTVPAHELVSQQAQAHPLDALPHGEDKPVTPAMPSQGGSQQQSPNHGDARFAQAMATESQASVPGATAAGPVPFIAASPTADAQPIVTPAATAAPSAATPLTAEPATIALPEQMSEDDAQNVSRVMRGLRTTLNQNGGAVTLRLTPPDMGVVRIHLHMGDGIIRASFATQTDAARDLLQSQMQSLRQSLEAQGLNVERITVQTMPSQSMSDAGSQRQDQGQSPDGRSRGQYDPQQGNDPRQNDPRRQPSRFDGMLEMLENQQSSETTPA